MRCVSRLPRRRVVWGAPAFTDLALDAVAALEGGVEAGDRVWGVQAPKMRIRSVKRERILSRALWFAKRFAGPKHHHSADPARSFSCSGSRQEKEFFVDLPSRHPIEKLTEELEG